MKLFPSESIKSKISLLMVLVAGLATFFATVTFVVLDIYRFNAELKTEFMGLVEVVGRNSTAALEFNDKGVGKETINSLSNNPKVLAAYIYDSNDNIFASLEKESNNFSLQELKKDTKSNLLGDNYRSFQRPILLDGKTIGTIFIVSDLNQIRTSIKRYIAIVILVLAINLLIIYLLSVHFQKLISMPISHLAGIVGKVSNSKDYSIRAKKHSNDEIGYLVEKFNEMLEYIQQRDTALQSARSELENRVKDRTQELEKEVYERKRVTEVLRESQQMLSTVMDNIPQAIFWKDSNFVYLGCNKTFASHAGLEDVSDIFGKTDEELPWSDEDTTAYLEAERKVFETKTPQYRSIETQRQKDKQAVIEVNRIPLLDSEYNTIGLLGTYEDITQRSAMEEDLARAQRLESLGILAGGIAHDFNNLLTGILGNITLSRSLLGSGEDISDRLKDAEFASLRARDLTMQLLTFAKGGEPIKKVVMFEHVLEQSANLSLRGSNVVCDFDIDENLWPVEIDEGQITQVLNNIIINSNQAMPEGGTIKIEAQNVNINDKSKINIDYGNYVKVTIKDEGIGIPTEYLSKVFDPYFSTKKDGHGLGLTSCYSIIKKHKGIIYVNSELGKGTDFIFYLPANSDYIYEAKEEKPTYQTGNGKILFMDDEELIRDVAKEILESEGYNLEFAIEGREAIDMYKNSINDKQKFDLVILDLTIPGGLGGKDTIKEILKMDPEAKAIVSSGYSNDPIMAEYTKYGFSDFVPKPYNYEQLVNIVNKVISI